MFDLQSIFIYLSLYAIMSILAFQAKRNDSWCYIILAILIYSVVFGVRYNVGMDYISYLKDYQYVSILPYNIMHTHYEPGFRFIIKTLTGLNVHFSWFFGIIAFLQLYLVFRSNKDVPEVYNYLVFTFIIGCVWLTYANGLRQQLAFCLFAFSLIFVEKKLWLFYYLTIALGISMHSSAAVLAIMYPLLRYRRDWLEKVNVYIQTILFFIAFILGNINVVQKYFGILEPYASFLGYERYFLDKYNDAVYTALDHKGIGYYVLFLLTILLIWNSTNYKQFFDRKYVYYVYNLYYVGVLLNYACAGSLLIWRINYYFYGFGYIVGAYALLYSKRNNKKLFWTLVILYVLIFIATMYRNTSNTSLFRFYWQIPNL